MTQSHQEPSGSRFIPVARTWRLAHDRTLQLGPRGYIKAVVNVTPDSFSDGGRFDSVVCAVEAAQEMAGEGAAIIDIGGESTRPGAGAVDAQTEQARVLPVIEMLAQRSNVLISVDTYRAQTARLAIEAGAHIVNDVWGLQKDPEMAAIVAQCKAGICIMHTGRERTKAADVIEDQLLFLRQSLKIAEAAGIDDEAITTSRKRFIGAVSGRETEDRDIATAATTAILRLEGAAIFRVHDIAANRDALAMADAVLAVRATLAVGDKRDSQR